MDGHDALDVNLGDPVDLWSGLKPRFVPAGLPWRLPPGRPLLTETAFIPSGPVEWTSPSLSLHDSVADLLDYIFDYAASPMIGLEGPLSVTAGALMAGGSLAELESRLKMDLTVRPAPAYLLVRLTGRRGTVYYPPEWEGLNRKPKILEWLTPEGRNAMARLRLREMRHEGIEFYGDITARQARRYVGYFHDMGTHVVRSLGYGERLFQVFEATEALLPGLRESFAREAEGNRVDGPAAFGMAQFTRRPWVTSASPILSASDGAEARQAANHQIWTNDGPGDPPSLLSQRAMPAWNRAAILDALPARSIVAVSFANQALYLEDHRADAWARIMRAGLCQRFPALRLSGWRQRDQFPMGAFVATAGLAGEEALCRPAVPTLPPLAFALDLTMPGLIENASEECLAFFAAANPGIGRAIEFVVDCPAFDPAGLKIPFVDGAACFTDREGERTCLVESVLLGRSDDGRPGIAGAPAEPGVAALARHAPQLAAYVRLLGQMQGPGFPPGADSAVRRIAAWLAESAAAHPDLVPLRWQALQVARGAGPAEPGTMALDRALEIDLVQLLTACMDLLALPSDSPELGTAAGRLDDRLRAFYAGLPGALEAVELDRRSLAAGEALQRRFARFGAAPDLPERVVPLFAAGATLCLPPDPYRMPHGVVPGDDSYAIFWNALLGLRARHAECRAILLALQGRTSEAVDRLEREVIGCGEGPADPAGDLLSSLDALSGSLTHLGAMDRDLLRAEMAELLDLRTSAYFLQIARGGAAAGPETGPQLHRLLIMLEVLQLCRAAGLPSAPLESLAPAALAARIDRTLREMADHRRTA